MCSYIASVRTRGSEGDTEDSDGDGWDRACVPALTAMSVLPDHVNMPLF